MLRIGRLKIIPVFLFIILNSDFPNSKIFLPLHRGFVAQLVEQQTLNLRAEGSSPSEVTK